MSVKTTTTTRDVVVVPPLTMTTEIIYVETFQFSSTIATTTSVVINLSDIEDGGLFCEIGGFLVHKMHVRLFHY